MIQALEPLFPAIITLFVVSLSWKLTKVAETAPIAGYVLARKWRVTCSDATTWMEEIEAGLSFHNKCAS